MQIGGEFQVELELFPVVNRITNKIKKKKVFQEESSIKQSYETCYNNSINIIIVIWVLINDC